ncbi:beta-galactosidase [Promicromonospora sp. AC04]|uniref:beta-galactosidase n=1 Tax=Promicromonospora sp. AC04 TaxID=2135723 RepID=UPI000D4877C2|nr:beta-galactosidase [Promicromonospora sp. AC04]PUB27610.1 beta-galactosidase [Promicromonospora sp. AC04]
MSADTTASFAGQQPPVTALDGVSALYGGDYNPEQWPQEVWARDMELFREANINSVTINVFSWARLQPSEDVYDFAELDKIVTMTRYAGLSIVMATSTGALPAWLSLRHPEVNRVDHQGRRMRHRERHNPCINSPVYRRLSTELAGRLAERYGPVPNLAAWHVSNEYGGFCWCDICAGAFREWLRARYGTVNNVNEAWNAAFWGHTYHSFEEIFPPNELGDTTAGNKAVLGGLSLDYRRFYGEAVLESFRDEKAAIRQHDPDRPVTTNMMGTFPDYDYFQWSEDLDIVSWDSYPSPETTAAETCFRHDLMRAVGHQKPFMLMEQTPSRQNWQPYNALKRPQQLRQQSWQAISRGADTVQFFQLRQSRAGCEKFHGAVIGADGSSQTRTFTEVAQLGEELAKVSRRVLGSHVEPGKVAIVFDWPSNWGLAMSTGPSQSLDYVAQVENWYREIHRRNIPVDIISTAGPFDDYQAVIAPCLYMLGEQPAAALRAYVGDGGRLLLTTMSALVDELDRLHQGQAPVPLRDLAGVTVEETDALRPGHSVALDFGETVLAGASAPAGTILCDVLRPDPDTTVLARYGGEYYAGIPALTFAASAGNGGVLYSASLPDEAGVALVIDALLAGTDVRGTRTPAGVAVSRRIRPDGTVLTFLVNSTSESHSATPGTAGTDILTGHSVGETIELGPYGVVVIETPAGG